MLRDADKRRPHIVAFAYACAPGEGSEPAAGWWWAQMLAEIGEVSLITRANNRSAIEAALADAPPSARRIDFVYVDLPERVRFWKRGQRGVRAYYLLWQYAALSEARRLSRERPFDVAWHLTLANGWLGSTASRLGVPFVYGPVGGGVGIPWRLSPILGPKGMCYEVLRSGARLSGRYLNPLARMSWRRASLILVQNDETKQWLPTKHRGKATVFPNVVLSDAFPTPASRPTSKAILFAGRLVALKGLPLAIRALKYLPDWYLIILGDGSDRRRLEELALDAGVFARIDFRGWKPRQDVLRAMRLEASVFVFPSFHDEAGWAVVEAMSCGLPVVSLDVGGPPALAGRAFAVSPRFPEDTARAFADRIVEANASDRAAVKARAQSFEFTPRVTALSALFEAAVGRTES